MVWLARMGGCAAVALAAAACASPQIEQRLDALERRMAELEARPAAEGEAPPAAAATAQPAPPDGEAAAGYPGEQQLDGWLLTGVGAADFGLAKDDGAVRVERTAEGSRRFVALLKAVPADALVGQNKQLQVAVRTEGLEGPAMCIIKVQRERRLAYMGFLAVAHEEVAATTSSYQPCKTQLAIPEGAKWVLYGVTYRGGGRVWVKDETFK